MKSHFPDFNVMAQAEHWDDRTRSVVEDRLQTDDQRLFLTEHEAKTLTRLIMHLVYENRPEIVAFALHHVDRRLHEKTGEAQRKPGIPAEDDLVRTGLLYIDHIAGQRHGAAFMECSVDEQFALVSALQKGQVEPVAAGTGGPASLDPWADAKQTVKLQKALFKKLLTLTVDALASHPIIWSEIGYAGPAYPRGYYRIERGLTDPWEARRPKPVLPEPDSP